MAQLDPLQKLSDFQWVDGKSNKQDPKNPIKSIKTLIFSGYMVNGKPISQKHERSKFVAGSTQEVPQ